MFDIRWIVICLILWVFMLVNALNMPNSPGNCGRPGNFAINKSCKSFLECHNTRDNCNMENAKKLCDSKVSYKKCNCVKLILSDFRLMG
jgi:hypothetical protein